MRRPAPGENRRRIIPTSHQTEASVNGLRRGRPKAYNLYTADEARAFLGRVRGVTNERQARRTFVAEAAALGFPIAIEEVATRYDAGGMEPPSALTLEWRDEARSYVYRPRNPDVDLEDGFFELVRGRYPTVDEAHFTGGSAYLRYRR